MKNNIILLRLSEDGVCDTAFTNIKAMYEFINSELTANGCYKPIEVNGDTIDNLKYSYSNLVKIISDRKQRNCLTLATIDCEGNSSIEVMNIAIISKY